MRDGGGGGGSWGEWMNKNKKIAERKENCVCVCVCVVSGGSSIQPLSAPASVSWLQASMVAPHPNYTPLSLSLSIRLPQPILLSSPVSSGPSLVRRRIHTLSAWVCVRVYFFRAGVDAAHTALSANVWSLMCNVLLRNSKWVRIAQGSGLEKGRMCTQAKWCKCFQGVCMRRCVGSKPTNCQLWSELEKRVRPQRNIQRKLDTMRSQLDKDAQMFSFLISFNLFFFSPSFTLLLPTSSQQGWSVCLNVSLLNSLEALQWTEEKATSACNKSDIYARRVLGRRDRQLASDGAVVCGFQRATWEAFKCRSGTDGR